MILRVLLLATALGSGAAHAQAVNDYPTNARAEYVFACMATNGQTRDMLDRCSCAIDQIAEVLPYDDYVEAETVLRMQQTTGDRAGLVAAGHDTGRIATRVIQLFLQHALRDGFFHADMHHGNLKVAANGDVLAYDFGIMGEIDEYTRRIYAEILYGFIQRDYRRVARVHFEAGYVPRDRDEAQFARALRAVGEPIFGADASRISMANLLAYLFEVTERFGMRTQTQLILLQRTMVVVEGVARSVDPQLNIWDAAKPVVTDYIRSNIGPKALAGDIARVAQTVGRYGPLLPRIVEQALWERVHPEDARAAQPIVVRRGAPVWLAVALALGAGAALGMMLV